MKRSTHIALLILALFGFLCVGLTSCNLHKHCARTLRDSTMIHDSIRITDRFVPIPKDSIVYRDSVPCKDFILDLFGNNGLTTSIKVVSGKAVIKTLGPDSAKAPVTERFHSEKSDRVEECPPCICPTNWYDPYCRWWMIISLIGIAGVGAWKGARYFKP